MSDYPMLISNKLHSFRNFMQQNYKKGPNLIGLILRVFGFPCLFNLKGRLVSEFSP